MTLGLGSNPTILNALKTSGEIASPLWSMFWGRTGATANTQLDCGFVFVGCGRAKVSGANYTPSFSSSKSSCSTSMLVTITNIVLNFPNGTDASLFDRAQATAMAACLMISLRRNCFDHTLSAVLTNNLFRYSGDMTIQFDSGLSVRIPNDQLVVPNLTIDPQTVQLVATCKWL